MVVDAEDSIEDTAQSIRDELAPITEPDSSDPEWVELYQKGEPGAIAGTGYYLGIGESSLSQEDADEKARVSFAKNVETRVVSSMKEVYKEQPGVEENSISISLEVSTDLSLKGVGITHQFIDPLTGIYYSMIKIDRQEYMVIVEQNIREELLQEKALLERKRLEMEQEAQEQEARRLAEEQKLRDEQLEQQQALQRESMRKAQREAQLQQFAEYLHRQPYSRLISFDNGELFTGRHMLSTSVGLDDNYLVRNLGYALTFGEILQFGTSHRLNFNDGIQTASLVYSDAEAKIGLLNNNGRLVKVSAALGVRGFLTYPVDKNRRTEISGTLYGAVVLAAPQLLYTDLSLYAGLDRIAVGAAWYPLFNVLGNSLALLGETTYLYNEDLQGLQSKAILTQVGLQLRAGDAFCSRLTWEDNFSTFVLAIDINWKRGR